MVPFAQEYVNGVRGLGKNAHVVVVNRRIECRF